MSFRVLFFPGLGADERMYAPLLEHLPDVEASFFVNRDHRDGEDLAGFARRQLESQGFAHTDYDLVVATSIGGMIAQEAFASGLLRTERLMLISTGFTGKDFSAPVGLAAKAARFVPGFGRGLIQQFAAFMFPVIRYNLPGARIFADMLRSCEPDFLFHGIKMIRTWRPNGPTQADLEQGLPERTLHVHGAKDPVFPVKRVSAHRAPEAVFEQGGDHILILRQAEAIAGLIRDQLSTGHKSDPLVAKV